MAQPDLKENDIKALNKSIGNYLWAETKADWYLNFSASLTEPHCPTCTIDCEALIGEDEALKSFESTGGCAVLSDAVGSYRGDQDQIIDSIREAALNAFRDLENVKRAIAVVRDHHRKAREAR